jgi:L-lactate dehydrogenase complex protein LldG
MTTRAESSSNNRPLRARLLTRTEFLDRIRGEMQKTRGLFPASVSERPARPLEAVELIRRQLAERWPETLERFRLEFERVGGVFHRAARVTEVPAVVADIARERQAGRLVAWAPGSMGADLTGALAREGLTVEAVPLSEASEEERRRARASAVDADLGLTGVDAAIAETGTLVLRSGPGRPRSTSLLPPCHVALMDRSALVESLRELGVLLEAWRVDPSGRGTMINLITGPSRTADIELTLTRGVHGPKEVHAIFVDGGLGG